MKISPSWFQLKKPSGLFPAIHYKGCANKSGKKRLNSINIPAVKVIQAMNSTGAIVKNLPMSASPFI
jgi:hypothetical protein